MIFICNIMDYNCHDELIIMLLLSIIKQVTSEQNVTHLCLLEALVFMLGWVMQKVKSGPVVIRWSLCNSQYCTHYILIYSLIKRLKNHETGSNLNKQKAISQTYFLTCKLKDRGQTLFSEKSSWWSPKGLSLEPLEYIINGAYMTGNVPNTVWLSPHGLLTFRFTVHTWRWAYSAGDLSASQVSSVETSMAYIYSSGLTLYPTSRGNIYKSCCKPQVWPM